MTLDAPVWRLVGSAASWLLFAFSFSLFCLGLLGVLQVGGSCADGGPFVIAVHCPETTDAFTLGGVYGGVGAVFVAIVLARRFGVTILLAWTILFLVLGIPFLIAGFPFVIGGLLFVAMALAPLVIEWRAAGLQRVFLGTTNAAGTRFRERDSARASMFMPGTPNPPDAVAATASDWGRSLGLAIIPAAVGVLLAYAVFTTAG